MTRLFGEKDAWVKGRIDRRQFPLLDRDAAELLDFFVPDSLMPLRAPDILKQFWEFCINAGCASCRDLRETDGVYVCMKACREAHHSESLEPEYGDPLLVQSIRALDSYRSNPLLNELRPWYAAWALSSPRFRNAILLLTLFGEAGVPVGGYRQRDLCNMAGARKGEPRNRGPEIAKHLIELGIITAMPSSGKPRYGYRRWGAMRMNRDLDSELLLRRVRELLRKWQGGLRAAKCGREAVLERLPSSSYTRPRVFLGQVPPVPFTAIAADVDEIFEIVWRASWLPSSSDKVRRSVKVVTDRLLARCDSMTPNNRTDLQKFAASGLNGEVPTLLLYSLP